jgi:predicted DNA-binding transcriptional regulator AlpA
MPVKQVARIWIMVKTAYSINEVADFFKVSTRTIRVWVEKDETFPRPFKKFGTLRFNRHDIEQYWADNTLAPKEVPLLSSHMK